MINNALNVSLSNSWDRDTFKSDIFEKIFIFVCGLGALKVSTWGGPINGISQYRSKKQFPKPVFYIIGGRDEVTSSYFQDFFLKFYSLYEKCGAYSPQN